MCSSTSRCPTRSDSRISASHAAPDPRCRRPGSPGRPRCRPVAGVHVQPLPSALRVGERRDGGRRRDPLREFGFRHVDVEATGRHVEHDRVAGADQAQWTAGGRLRRDAQNDGAVGRPAHPPVADPDHVADTQPQQLGRQGQVRHLRHSRVATRSAPAQYQHRIGVDVQARVVDPGMQVLDRVEDNGQRPVPQQLQARGGGFDHCPVRREIAVQHGDPGLRLQRRRP